MTPDDDLVEHLRHLARSTPPSTVDRDEVLRRGRRRRGTRAGGVGVAVLAAVVASGVGVHALVSPAPERIPFADLETAAPSPTPDPDAPVVFDEATGTVVEPLDAYQWSDREAHVVWAAQGLFRTGCLASYGPPVWPEGGVPGGPEGVVISAVTDEGIGVYGLWSPSHAEGTKYLTAPAGDYYKGGGSASDHGDGDDEFTLASKECFGRAVAADLEYDVAELDAVAPAPAELVRPQQTEEGRALIYEWAECVRAAGFGVRTDDHPLRPLSLVPDRTVEVTPDERRQMAAVDLGCKERLGTVEAYADIVAREQNAYIARAGERLLVEKALQERVLAASVAYLEREGVEVPPLP